MGDTAFGKGMVLKITPDQDVIALEAEVMQLANRLCAKDSRALREIKRQFHSLQPPSRSPTNAGQATTHAPTFDPPTILDPLPNAVQRIPETTQSVQIAEAIESTAGMSFRELQEHCRLEGVPEIDVVMAADKEDLLSMLHTIRSSRDPTLE